ncbi:uncharacterized protein LOC142774685 isoform X2 [Rhipicephalus microplus]|uniref:uncharacterized protein LOC142774685 isoform X2 n=1 Tax=Rhipicephalus microplus TaxID=6941 RepID=UPI003F6C4386
MLCTRSVLFGGCSRDRARGARVECFVFGETAFPFLDFILLPGLQWQATMPVAHCVVPLCRSTMKSGVPLHAFPRDEPRRQQWIAFVRACGRQDWSPVQGSRVCGLHFETYYYNPKPPDSTFMIRPHPVLMSCAVPSRFLALEQDDASQCKRPQPETYSVMGHMPNLPWHMLTHVCARGHDKGSLAGPSVADARTQSHIEIGIRGTQVNKKPESKSQSVQTESIVCHIELVVKKKRKARKRASKPRICTRPAVHHAEIDMKDEQRAPKPASRSGFHPRPTVGSVAEKLHAMPGAIA